MKIIKPYTEIIGDINGNDILKKIEMVGRTCYKSEDRITDGSAEKFVASLIKNGHEAMLEHASFTVKFVVDRGVSHEIVRHRLASFAQESTRYCAYNKDQFGGEITFIEPCYWEKGSLFYNNWLMSVASAETDYFHLLNCGTAPEKARAVLPNSLKTELVMTTNLREWRHFFNLRAANKTGKAHPQMLEVTRPLLDNLKQLIPVVFDDITYKE